MLQPYENTEWIKKMEEGAFANIVKELMLEDTSTYSEMMRMA